MLFTTTRAVTSLLLLLRFPTDVVVTMQFPVYRGSLLVAVFVVAFIVLSCISSIAQSAVDDDDLAGFPERPNIFRNPDELKEYLRALNEYFAIAGRPRYEPHTLRYRRRTYPVLTCQTSLSITRGRQISCDCAETKYGSMKCLNISGIVNAPVALTISAEIGLHCAV
jgi:Pancreatic hormone peptide